MVEHNIKDNLNSVFVKLTNKLFKLSAFVMMLVVALIACVRGKEAYGVIAPVIVELAAVIITV